MVISFILTFKIQRILHMIQHVELYILGFDYLILVGIYYFVIYHINHPY